MTNAVTDSNPSPIASGWSNRILIAAVAGILFLTLYPFRFSFARHLADNAPPYLLGGTGKPGGPFDVFLNVLLFVPYGFGVAGKLREQGRSWVATLGLVLAAGVLLSYAIELVQIYIPFRDSGWEDVLTNSTGSVIGFLLLGLCGTPVLRSMSACENTVATFLTLPRAVWVLSAYFGVWLAISIPLQQQTRLEGWSSDGFLVVGNGAPSRLASAWKGEILRLDIWDTALAREFAQNLTSRGSKPEVDPAPLAAYDFSGSSPLYGQRNFVPDLSWAPKAPASPSSGAVTLDGESWLVSRGPITTLVNAVQRTHRFSVRIVCKPAQAGAMDGRIVSISRDSGPADMEIRQNDADLVFWFRNPLTARRPRLAWTIPDVFAANQTREILFSYDGSTLTLHIDSQEGPHTYPLGPGPGLARLVRRIKPGELEGYQYIFYALVFVPGGCLVGLAWRNSIPNSTGRLLFIVLGLLVPAVLLEIALVRVSGRTESIANIVLAASLAIAGSLWANADLGARDQSFVRRTQGLAR